jgi:hypothetical protein
MPRLQIDIKEQKLKVIEGLMNECGFSTKKDLFQQCVDSFSVGGWREEAGTHDRVDRRENQKISGTPNAGAQ